MSYPGAQGGPGNEPPPHGWEGPEPAGYSVPPGQPYPSTQPYAPTQPYPPGPGYPPPAGHYGPWQPYGSGQYQYYQHGQQFAGAPMGGMHQAPFGHDPMTGLPYSDKSRVAAGVLSIFLGYFGVGRFYIGHTGLGIAQLAVNLVLTAITLGLWLALAWIWPLVDGVVLLAGQPRDGHGRPLR